MLEKIISGAAYCAIVRGKTGPLEVEWQIEEDAVAYPKAIVHFLNCRTVVTFEDGSKGHYSQALRN